MFDALNKYNFWDGNVKGCGILRKCYLNRLKALDANKTIVTLTGGRRVGKSFIVRQFIRFLIEENNINPKQIFYANLFLRELSELKSSEGFSKAVKLWEENLKVDSNIRKYIIIDEIQEINNWELIVNSFYEDFTSEYKLIITGSNSKLLSGELSTYIAGRSFDLTIFPLSYNEYLDFVGKEPSKDSFISYMKDGGMPEVVLAENDFARSSLITSTIDSVIMRDITYRYNIRNMGLLKKIVDYFCASPSDEISINKAVNILQSSGYKASIHTISDYIDYLKEAYLIHTCPVFSYKRYDILRKIPQKFYLNDHSFTTINNGFKNIGKLLENIVYIELLRRNHNVKTLKIKNKEVDFIAVKGDEKKYYQISYMIGEKDSETYRREFGNLLEIKDHYPKFVLTLDDLNYSPVNGIRHQNILDFMMED